MELKFKMIMKIRFLIMVFLILISNSASAFTKEIGKGYCTIRHPLEAMTSSRVTCESQHVIQQQADGGNKANTIWINTTEHDYLDRSSDAPWEKERPWISWGDENLERAYMMGTYATGYHFILYDHHGSGSITLFSWDGMSHLTYMIASVTNFITKEMTYIGYQMDRGSKGQTTQYIDAIIGIFIDLIEVALGIIYGIVGLFIGTFLNPIDTLMNIPGGVTLSIEAIVEGVANTVSDIISLFTFGFIEL